MENRHPSRKLATAWFTIRFAIPLAICAGLILPVFGAGPVLAAGDDPSGAWLVEDGSAIVQISECGSALCGTIIWSQKPKDVRGEVLCGRQVLGDAIASGAGSWDKGWIYSPKTDSKYAVSLKLAADGTLDLHVTAGLFGRDQIWKRPTIKIAPCTP
jgi:uncharacterized protein (DUF2147 family)